MTARRIGTVSNQRTPRMAPSAPRQRGGGTGRPPAGIAELFSSRRVLEFTGGGFIWR